MYKELDQKLINKIRKEINKTIPIKRRNPKKKGYKKLEAGDISKLNDNIDKLLYERS